MYPLYVPYALFVRLFVCVLNAEVFGKHDAILQKRKHEIFEKTAQSLNAGSSLYSLPTFQQSILILLNLFSHLLRRRHLKGS